MIRDTTQTPPRVSVNVDVALSGVALHLLAVAVVVFLGWRVVAHVANRWGVSLGLRERLRERVDYLPASDSALDESARSYIGPTWPRLLGTVALVAIDAATPDVPLLAEGLFDLAVEATRRLGVHGALFLGEIRILAVVTLLALLAILITYLTVCATVAAFRVLESRLAGWRGSVG